MALGSEPRPGLPTRPSGLGPPQGTSLTVQGSRFRLNDRLVFLCGASLYGALGEPDDLLRRGLDDLQRWGLNWIRVWATWTAFGEDVSALDAAVAEAFGWPPDISEDDALAQLLALNLEREPE